MKPVALLFIVALFIGCGGPDKAATEVYTVATTGVRGKLKSPSSAKFVAMSDKAVTTVSGDTTTIKDDSTKIVLVKDSLAMVIGHYESSNSYGVMLPGMYEVVLKRDSTGAWVGMTGVSSIDFEVE